MTDASEATDAVLGYFADISKIPRSSEREGRLAEWITRWAGDHRFGSERDGAGNLVITVPATSGREREDPVILQGHLDMVCEKVPGSSHDFGTDPIVPVREGEWLTANGTTLGADNGIAVALAMHAAVGLSSHPPLELLFTVEEEHGLVGASRLDPALLSGRSLINLDTEDEGVITVGCAGGRDAVVRMAVEETEPSGAYHTQRLALTGLIGGHSGVDIHRQLGNSIKILARTLDDLLRDREVRDALVAFGSMHAGSAHNAIPRDGFIDLLLRDTSKVELRLRRLIETATERHDGELSAEEHVEFDLTRIDRVTSEEHSRPGSIDSLERLVSFLIAAPHGALRMLPGDSQMVETSCNLAVCKRDEQGFSVTMSQRSAIDSRTEDATRTIEALADLAGAKFEAKNAYPAWPPNYDSKSLERAKRVYLELNGSEPSVEVVHAGLECAVIGSRLGGAEMISIGPTIQGAHSPDERLLISSIERTWEYIKALLG